MPELLSLIVDGDNLRLAVDHLGTASDEPPLVFLHGLGASSTRGLRPIAAHPLLIGRQRVLLDLPGFGQSTAPSGWTATIEAHADAVASALAHLDLGPTHLVGHSMGGSIAILLAARHPGLVRQLTVAEPLLDPAQATLSAHIARQSEVAFVRRGIATLRMATRRQAARGDIAAQAVLPDLERADPAIMHRSAVSLLAERTPGFGQVLATLPLPRTFIAGSRTGIDAAPLRAASIAVIVIPDAGHAMLHEQPDAFVRALLQAV